MENYNDDLCNLVSLLYVKMPVVVLLTIAFALSSPISTWWKSNINMVEKAINILVLL